MMCTIKMFCLTEKVANNAVMHGNKCIVIKKNAHHYNRNGNNNINNDLGRQNEIP